MKGIKYFLLTVIFIGLHTELRACDCPIYQMTELDSMSFESSEIVLIGKVVAIHEDHYKIEVKELFKGSVANSTLVAIYAKRPGVRSSCGFVPAHETDYLLYLSRIEADGKTYYYASSCRASRSLDFKQVPIAENHSDKSWMNWTEEWIRQMKGDE